MGIIQLSETPCPSVHLDLLILQCMHERFTGAGVGREFVVTEVGDAMHEMNNWDTVNQLRE